MKIAISDTFCCLATPPCASCGSVSLEYEITKIGDVICNSCASHIDPIYFLRETKRPKFQWAQAYGLRCSSCDDFMINVSLWGLLVDADKEGWTRTFDGVMCPECSSS